MRGRGVAATLLAMSHALYRLGRFAARRPWTVIGSWLAVAAVVIAASGAFGRQLSAEGPVPGLDSQQATELLTAAGSDRAGLTAQVVLTPRDARASFFDSASARAALSRVQGRLASLPRVLRTTDTAAALAAGPAAAAARGVVSPDGRIAVVRVQYPVIAELSAGDLRNLKAVMTDARLAAPLRIEMRGDLFASFEQAATGAGELVGLVAAAVIVLVAFGSFVAAGLPLGLAVFGLALGVASMKLITYVVDIPSFAPQMAGMIGLAVGIDYSLFLLTRHREYLARGMTVGESVGRAVATAGQAVTFAGATVVIAILGLSVAGVPFMTAAGVATSVLVLIMVVASITLLPAFLGLAGHRVARRGPRQPRRSRGRRVSPGWERWLERVSRHPWRSVAGVLAVLLTLSAPVLALRLGSPDDGSLPPTRTERRAFDLVTAGFGPGANGPIVVAVDTSQDAAVVGPLRDAIARDPGVSAVARPEVDDDAGVATMVAFLTTGPQDAATVETIRRLRTHVLPSVLARSPARAHVGGQAASLADIGDRVEARLPLFVAAVVLLSLVLLTVVFRSVLVPLKAAILNLLSIGASYGVLVMVFQWGWGVGLLGLEGPVPIDPFIPLFMFAVLFGVSMDYEVFLLSRIREEYLLTGDNRASVIRGIAGTARVITSAALIMILVFLSFALGDVPAVKMVGLGLATAILVDVTIVRLILVPAAMTLMGDANWWLPTRLGRLLPRIDIEGEARLPAPEMEAGPAPARARLRVPA